MMATLKKTNNSNRLLGLSLALILSPALSPTLGHAATSPSSPTPVSAAAPVNYTDIVGVWRSFDDKTGYAKSLIKIEKSPNGNYGGTIIQVLSHPGYTPKTTCQDCPAPYTDKPIEGLHILWGLKADGTSNYSGGKILDPLSGQIYSAKIALADGGKTLTLRGFLGVSLFGRSQVWTREP